LKRIVMAGVLCGLVAVTGCEGGSPTAAPTPSVTPTTTATADPSTASPTAPGRVSIKQTCRAVGVAIVESTSVFGYPRSHVFPNRLDKLAEQADPRIVAEVRAYSSVATAFLRTDPSNRADTAGLIDAAFLRINSTCMGEAGVSLR
jgi:hypothetical protein